MRKKLKYLLRGFFGLILLLFVVKWVQDARYFSDYDPNLPFHAVAGTPESVDDVAEVFGAQRPRHYQRFTVAFESRPGEKVPTLVTLPKTYTGRLPLIILLHGAGQGKEFLDEITSPFNEAGFAMACFDQVTRGERKVEGGPLAQVVAFRQRPWKTVNDTRRLIDYLETRPEVDPARIYLIGASFGAITGCSAVALEKRITAAVLVVGGGNLRVMLNAPFVREHVPYLAYVFGKPLALFLMRPGDPIHYVAQTSPTPLLFLNGAEDTWVTPEAGKELFNAAGDPKEIRWYPCDHPGLREKDNPVVLEMLDDACQWFLEKDMPFRQDPGKQAPAAVEDAT